MDPATFGMVAVGAVGGSLIVVHLLEQYGFSVNKTMVTLILEGSKLGMILWLLKKLQYIFL